MHKANVTGFPVEPVRRCLKKDVSLDDRIVTAFTVDDAEAFTGIRCPLCAWQPDARSRWCCYSDGSPEPPFESCLTVWNTFSTRGRCPGCNHQWCWTSCLKCEGWSLHEDWYQESQDSGPAH